MALKRRKSETDFGEKIGFRDVSVGDTILLNGDFRLVKEIATRDEDEYLGFTCEERTIWRHPTQATRRLQ